MASPQHTADSAIAIIMPVAGLIRFSAIPPQAVVVQTATASQFHDITDMRTLLLIPEKLYQQV
jgi:hypothetical protein